MVDAFIAGSRALVAVAARSLADLDEDVSLSQYRALVVLATRGPQCVIDLSDALAVAPSTASRMIERLVRKRLVQRSRFREDRRMIKVQLTKFGRDVIRQVTDRRRREIATILEQMPATGREILVSALYAFADAAGEGPEPEWALGWDR